MNKKGGVLMYGLMMLVFIILWAGWLSGLFSTMAGVAIANGATGIEAFLLSNLNLIIFVFILVGVGWMYNQAG